MSKSNSKSNQTQQANQNASIPDIFQMAQQIAQSMPPPEGDQVDMQGMVKHVTESVMNMMGNGDVDINGMTNSLMQGMMNPEQMAQMTQGLKEEQNQEQSVQPIANSKVKLPDYKFKEPKDTKNYEELESDDEADVFSPRTKDIEITLNVNLEDFYNGTKKKLAVRRKRLKKDKDGKIVQFEEKKKIIIPILPGMRDEQTITFNKEADEAQGHETGDIVVKLLENAHSRFEREADNLFIMKDISLYEAFALSCGEKINLSVKHLDGSYLMLQPDDKPLHDKDGIRKVSGEGMPFYQKEGKGDLYVRFNLVLPETFKQEDMETVKKLFPCCNEDLTNIELNKSRNVELEEVSESDLEELDYGYSDSESDSESDYSSSSEDEPPRKGFRATKKIHKNR